MVKHILLVCVGLCLLGFMVQPVLAQTSDYIVQRGDTLGQIAARHGTTVNALAEANRILNPNFIYPGQRLVIPTTDAGPPTAAPTEPSITQPPGFQLPAKPSALSAPLADARLSTSRPLQGQTVRLWVDLTEPARLEGTFRGQNLRFSPTDTGAWALVAIGPLAPLETFPVVITASNSIATASVSLPIAIQDAKFRTQNLRLDPQTSQLLDPELIESEAARLEALFKTGQDRPLWDGIFIAPSRGYITADFGERRRYNDGPIRYHEGIDYGLVTGTPVRVAAGGVVALAERLTVRGNTVFVDHGMGVYTGYFHMSELLVEPGQAVEPLQIIGRVGSTGLSTGPHLHWEFRLHGINVSPWQWMRENMP